MVEITVLDSTTLLRYLMKRKKFYALPKFKIKIFSPSLNYYMRLSFLRNKSLIDQSSIMIIFVMHLNQYSVQTDQTNNFITIHLENIE